MRRFYYNNRFDIWSIIIIILILASSFLLFADGARVYIGKSTFQFYSPCIFRFLTGINCPTCGLTRSLVSISHGNYLLAYNYNLAGFLVYALLIVQLILRSFRLILGGTHRFVRFLGYINTLTIVLSIIMIVINYIKYIYSI